MSHKKETKAALKELKASREETAATAAVAHNGGNILPSLLMWPLKLLNLKMIIIIFLAVVASIGSYFVFSSSMTKQESSTFVESIQDLAVLSTAEAHLKVIIQQEDNKLFGKEIAVNLPGTKREILLVVPVTVIAGVDLKAISTEDLVIDEEAKELTILLPEGSLVQEPSIQMEKVVAFSDEGLLRTTVDWEEGFELAAEAQAQAKQEAIELGLLQKAEQNAEKTLQEFFESIGYKATIKFK